MPLEAFADPATRLPLGVAISELERHARQLGRTDVGLLAAEAAEPGDFGPVELAARAARTASEALNLVARGYELLADGTHLAVERRDGRTTIRFWTEPDIPATPAFAEFALLVLVRLGSRYGFTPARPSLVRFSHPPVPHADACARAFDSEVRFNSSETGLELNDDLVRPLRTSNPVLAPVLAAHLEALAQRMARNPILGRVEEAIARDLDRGPSPVAETARRLATSERSLHRKLREAGTTYGELCDAVRARAALRLLEESDLSVKEIAGAIGFSDVATFHRAFKRWTGTTPARRRARGPDSVLPGAPDPGEPGG